MVDWLVWDEWFLLHMSLTIQQATSGFFTGFQRASPSAQASVKSLFIVVPLATVSSMAKLKDCVRGNYPRHRYLERQTLWAFLQTILS